MTRGRTAPKAKTKGTTGAKTTPAAKAKKLGYESAGAMKSVTRQYGLVKNEAGKWVRPDLAFLQRQPEAMGQGVNQTAQTPYDIGGARWLFGQGGVQYTGQRSDSAKRNPGSAYDASTQAIYKAAGLNAKGGGKKGKGKKGKLARAGRFQPPVRGILGGAAGEMGGIGAETAPFVPYAEADTNTTNYTRAQGKAYGRGTGESLAGQTSSPPEGTSAVTGETSGEAGGSKRKKRKVVTRKKNAKGNTVVRTRKRPGGKVVSKRVVRKGR